MLFKYFIHIFKGYFIINLQIVKHVYALEVNWYKRMWNFFYGIKQGETKEQYVERFSVFETFAVITPDGEWHEKAKMGWWACVSDEKENWNDGYYNAFIKNADPELTIAIVDCHI